MYKDIINKLNILNISFDEIEHDESTSCDHSKSLRQEA
jgi:hypothetical protein